MRPCRFVIFSLLIVSCSLPIARPAAVETLPAPSKAAETASLPAALDSTETALPTLAATATVPPCDPSTADYCITAGVFRFSRPINPPGNDEIDPSYPYASTQKGKRDAHHGVEFQNAFGADVLAAGGGEVMFADADKTVKFSPWNNFYGNVVIIRHADGMFTLYAHLSAVLVQAGDEVEAGDVIGQVGMSGAATGPHLHFEVRQGSDYADYFATQNPELWLFPPQGTGALSITLKTGYEQNYERPLVITRYATGSDDPVYTYYTSAYARDFEFNPEDAVLGNLPPGRYKIAFNDPSGLKERFVFVEEGRLTEVIFVLDG